MGMRSTDIIGVPGLSDRQLGELLGNSMSVNVLERVLARALTSAGLADWSMLAHHWESKAAACRRIAHLR